MKKTILLIMVVAAIVGTVIFLKSGPSDAPSDKPEPSVSASIKAAGAINNGLNSSYSHPDGTFSFKHPENVKVSATSSEEGEILTAEVDADSGFQAFIMPFDESGPMTPERIQADLPDAVINEPAKVSVGGEEALSFYGLADIGETYEVWAVHGGKLYQFMTPKNDKDWLEKILETWEWK